MFTFNSFVIILTAIIVHDSIRFMIWGKKECEAQGGLQTEDVRKHLHRMITAHIGIFVLSIWYGIKQAFECMTNWIDG